MNRTACFVALLAAASLAASAQDDVPVFRSDVTLVRVDVQVIGRDNRAITGLTQADFTLRDEGKPREIHAFSSENMPVDVLLLLDVSGSMRPHVERIANASREAMQVLGEQDRVGIMVFDRAARLRLPFRSSHDDVFHEFDNLLRQETFNGGTDITQALMQAADYVRRSGRQDARKAIVILTDDETEFGRDDARVMRALTRADAVLSALLAPNMMMRSGGGGYPRGGGGGYPGGGRRRSGGGGWPGAGGGWPGGGWPGGGGNGPIILGPGGGGNGPVVLGGGGTRSAGTAEIARESGGDSMPVDDASSFETTLARIRQRYALHFTVPPGAHAGQERNIDVALSDAAMRRHSGAEVRFRRTYLAPGDTGPEDSEVISQAPASGGNPPAAPADAGQQRTEERNGEQPRMRRRPAVDESGARPAPADSVGWRRADAGEKAPATAPVPAAQPASNAADSSVPVGAAAPSGAAAKSDSPAKQGGWRRADEHDRPAAAPDAASAAKPPAADAPAAPAPSSSDKSGTGAPAKTADPAKTTEPAKTTTPAAPAKGGWRKVEDPLPPAAPTTTEPQSSKPRN